jgi:transposase
MKKITFKSHNQGEILLFPPSLEEKIPQNSPSRLVNQVVEDLDISSLLQTYKGGGTSSYHPRMMLKVLFLSYLSNIYSCRKIAKQVQENIHYIWLAGGQEPVFFIPLSEHIGVLKTSCIGYWMYQWEKMLPVKERKTLHRIFLWYSRLP